MIQIIGIMNITNDLFQECLTGLIKYKIPNEYAFEIQKSNLQQVKKILRPMMHNRDPGQRNWIYDIISNCFLHLRYPI